MNNKLGSNLDANTDRKNAVPTQVKDAITRYLGIDSTDIDTRSVGSKIYNLILVGEKTEWEEAWISWSCESFWNSNDYPLKNRFAEELCLEWRQKVFILSIYDWIVTFSDSLQFEMLTPEEKIIADYIRKRFPGRDWRWVFAKRVDWLMG